MDDQEASNKFSIQRSIFCILLLFGVLHDPSNVSAQEYDIEYDLMEAPTIAEIAISKYSSNQLSLDNLECNEKLDEDRYICFEFTCQANGQPTPEILWFHNEQSISEDDNARKNIILSEDRRTMTVLTKGSTKPSNSIAGDYYCLAKNLAGRKPSDSLSVTGSTATSIEDILNPDASISVASSKELKKGTEPPTILNFENQKIINHQILLEELSCDDVDCTEGSGEESGSCDEPDYQHTCLELNCNIKGKPVPSHQWYHNDKLIESTTDTLILNDQTGSLTFIRMGTAEPDKEWLGNYHCTAENRHGKAHSEVLSIVDKNSFSGDLNLAPKVISPPNNYVPYGNSETLSCVVENTEEPFEIKWTKNGGMIEENPNIVIDGVNLEIKRFDASNKGNYACNVTNAYGYSYHNVFRGILNEQPTFLEHPLSTELYTGQTLILECQAKGFPFPAIKWMFKSKSESEFADITLRPDVCSFLQLRLGDTNNCKHIKIESTTDTNIVTSSLTIEKIDNDISGEFQCEALNDRGESERSDKANVTVYPATRILRGPTIPNDGMVNAQETVIMNCTVENHDEWMSLYQGKVEWMKDDQYITTDDDSRYSIEDNQLVIKDLKKSDAGTYVCIASSKLTGPATASGILKIVTKAIKIASIPSTVCGVKDKNISIKCIASGIPLPDITWTKVSSMGEGVLTTSKSEEDNKVILELFLSNVSSSDEEKYKCEAKNEYEVVMREVEVNVMSDEPYEYKHVFEKQSDSKFDCFPQCVDDTLEREWFLDGEPLVEGSGCMILPGFEDCLEDDDTRIQIEKDGKAIMITSMDDINVGAYTCKVSEKNIKRISEETTEGPDEVVLPLMEVHHLLGTAPTVGQEKLKDMKVLEGDKVKLNCDITGNPVPIKTWHKFLENVSDEDARIDIDDFQVLTIENVDKSDSGIYKCRGHNMLGDTVVSVNLQVGKSCQAIPVSNTSLELIPGKPVEFSVDVDVDPIWHADTTFAWNKNDGIDICNEENIECTNEITTSSRFRQNLKIDIPMDEDAGVYEFISSTSVENVEDPCSISYTLYKLNQVSKDITHVSFEDGKTETFECNIEIEPNNFVGEGITWSFSGDVENSWRWCQRSSSSCSERVTINSDNSITLIDSQFKDIGIYTCEIRSLAGRVSKSKTTYFPDLNAESHAESNHENYEEGKNVLLDCTFEIHPVLQKDTIVTWMKDGVVVETFPLKDEETNDVTTSKLYKFNMPLRVNNANPDDIGQYFCSVDNGMQNVLIQRHILFPSLTNLSKESNHIFQKEKLYLPCLIPETINRNITVTWLKDGIEHSDSLWVSPTNLYGDYSITVNANTNQPHGNYLCTISFPGLEKKVEIMHKVYKMPAIISKPMHKKLEDDESSTTLDCISETHSPQLERSKTVQWEHNSKKVVIEDEDANEKCNEDIKELELNGNWIFETLDSCKYFKHTNESLTIFNLTQEDVGNVTCIVDTSLGKPMQLTHIIEKEEEILWQYIWIAVIAAIVILIIIIIIIIIRCKKKRGDWSPVPPSSEYPENRNGGMGLPSTPNTNSTTSIPPPYGLPTNPRPRRSEDSIQFIDDSRHGSIDDLPGDRSRTLERKKMKRFVDNFDDTF